MPTGLRRFHHSGQFHFVTFSCNRRQPFLVTPEAKHTAEHILERVRAHQGTLVVAYVLMPEHVHLLTDEPERGSLATFLQLFKQQTSTALRSPETTQFWQTRYYDRNVRTHEEMVEKINYIHRNPVKRGLVAEPEHYTWSSALHYATGVASPVHLHRV